MPPFHVHPRPNTGTQDMTPPQPPLPAPTESSFTAEFGALLPPARYLATPHGEAAYYFFPPTAPTPATPTQTGTPPPPRRVLLIHGVQTPALGLLPLKTHLRAAFPRTAFATLDLWGHGLSSSPRQPHTASLFTSLIDAVLTDLSWTEGVNLIGYSFGAVLTMSYLTSLAGTAAPFPAGRVESYVLVAPAGLLRMKWFSEEERGLLSPSCPPAAEREASRFVIETLEGGALVVPPDWRETVEKGGVVAQAVKAWQLEQHEGHEASVVAIFRDGGVCENDELFVRARETGVKALVVLGEEDGLSTESEVRGFGFDVRLVPKAGHAVVRENAGEVAGHIASFWKGV